MESYEGYLVATTNLLDLMDNACLRRFDLKAKLDYMTDDQAEEMYRRLAQKWKFSVGDEVNNLRKTEIFLREILQPSTEDFVSPKLFPEKRLWIC